MEFSVGFAVVNNHDVLEKAIESVAANKLLPNRVVVIDNGDIKPYVPDPKWKDWVHVVRPQQNLGCAGSWNLLHKLIYPLTPIIMNDDCVISPDTLERMMAYERGQLICAYAFGCFRMDEEIWQRVGEFDAEFYPAYYEDADYRYRMKLTNTPRVEWELTGNGIKHGNDQKNYQQWTGEKLKWFYERLEANKQRFIQKWGGEADRETFTTPFNR